VVVEANLEARLGMRGRITVPSRVIEKLALKPGNGVSFTEDEQGDIVVKRIARSAPSSERSRKERRE
jgi:bifunctional DNA-binding transcriptional regulator/antitoxin component of YhaV-PrlF toxin-antitoxin module